MTAIASSAVLAQVPASDLAKPPANARHFVIQSTGGKHGDSWSWVTADGTRMGRESMNLRGQVFELDSSGKAGPDAMPSAIAIRGVTPTGDAGETFAISRRHGAMEESDRRRQRQLFGGGLLRVAGGTDRYERVARGNPARAPRQDDEPAARRKRARRQAGGPRRRQRRGEADHHVVGDLRHQHVTLAGVGRREQQVLRRSLWPRVAARGVRGRASEDSGCAGERDGGAGAGPAQVPRHSACGTSRIQRREVVRRRGRAVPGQSNGGR